MKNILLTTVCAVAVSGAAVGQGVVNWSFVNPNYMNAQTNAAVYSFVSGGGTADSSGAIGGTSTAANSFYFELLYNGAGTAQSAPSTLAALSLWQDTGLQAVNNTGTAGRLSCLYPSPSATVPWAMGEYDSIVLVGWSANLGTTWGGATGVANTLENWQADEGSIVGTAFFGVSSTGYITPNSSAMGVIGATLFGSTANPNGTPINSPNTQLYVLQTDEDQVGQVQSTPEPGTLALAALGGASLLLFRRKK